MAIFDFLNSQQTGTLNTTTSIDPQIKQAYLSNLNFADTVASRPYEQYGGPRIAGFTPDQMAAFGQIRGMQNQFQPALNQAQQLTQGVAGMQPGQIGYQAPTAAMSNAASINRAGVRNLTPGSFLSGNIAAYQNPYTDQVVNQTMRDIERQRTMADQGVRANAVRSGAFGGTREAIARAENDRNFLDTSARTLAQLRNQGFDTAANLMQADIGRDFQAQQANQGVDLNVLGQNAGFLQQSGLANQAAQNQFGLANASQNLQAQVANQANQLAFGSQRLGAAGQLGGLANLQQQLGLTGANALNQIGQQQQAQTQRNFDLANQDFQNQFNYPLQQLAIRQSALGANIPNTGQTQSQPLFENRLGQLLGVGQGINGLFGGGQSGGQSPVGSFLGGIGSSLGGLLDFDGSGGFNFGDIGAGFSQGADFLSGLFQ